LRDRHPAANPKSAACHLDPRRGLLALVFIQLDVFTQTPLTGNPLAIFAARADAS
jgi:hypothetical protein